MDALLRCMDNYCRVCWKFFRATGQCLYHETCDGNSSTMKRWKVLRNLKGLYHEIVVSKVSLHLVRRKVSISKPSSWQRQGKKRLTEHHIYTIYIYTHTFTYIYYIYILYIIIYIHIHSHILYILYIMYIYTHYIHIYYIYYNIYTHTFTYIIYYI